MIKVFLYSISLVILPLACSQNAGSLDNYNPVTEQVAAETLAGSGASSNLESISTDQDAAAAKQLIRTGNLRYEVSNLEEAYQFLNQQLKASQAVIQSDQSGGNYSYNYRRLNIRVPSTQFDGLIEALSKDVKYFDHKEITTEDVTEQFIDVEARLATKRILESKYLNILAKTNKTSEILEIEKSLSQIREEIESFQGRLNYLKNQVAMSTLSVEIYHSSTDQASSNQSYSSQMWAATVSGFQSLSGFLLILLNIWPYLLLLAVGVFAFRKRLLKKRRKNTETQSKL